MAKKPTKAPICPACGRNAKRAFDARYQVLRFFCCGMWSWGFHPLADASTHDARQRAHAAFDPLWQSMGLTRTEAYRRLALDLGLDPDACHMKLMDEATANRVPEAVKSILADLGFERRHGTG